MGVFVRKPVLKDSWPSTNWRGCKNEQNICEAAEAMLFNQDLPSSLWAEATGTTVYIQNRCLHAILENETPGEAFSGKKPEVGHLRVFKCLVYIHMSKEEN